MDILKPMFTQLQEHILRYLYRFPERSFNAREIALALGVSPTAIAKAIPLLEKEGLLTIEKGKASKRLSIKLNRDEPRVFRLKRIDNLRCIYESGLAGFLCDCVPGSTIILFGSYAQGEDISTSDIDIAIVGAKRREIPLGAYSKTLARVILPQFYDELRKVDVHLRESICNGIVLCGGISL